MDKLGESPGLASNLLAEALFDATKPHFGALSSVRENLERHGALSMLAEQLIPKDAHFVSNSLAQAYFDATKPHLGALSSGWGTLERDVALAISAEQLIPKDAHFVGTSLAEAYFEASKPYLGALSSVWENLERHGALSTLAEQLIPKDAHFVGNSLAEAYFEASKPYLGALSSVWENLQRHGALSTLAEQLIPKDAHFVANSLAQSYFEAGKPHLGALSSGLGTLERHGALSFSWENWGRHGALSELLEGINPNTNYSALMASVAGQSRRYEDAIGALTAQFVTQEAATASETFVDAENSSLTVATIIDRLVNFLIHARNKLELKATISFLERTLPIFLMILIAYLDHQQRAELTAELKSEFSKDREVADQAANSAHKDIETIEAKLNELTGLIADGQERVSSGTFLEVNRPVPICQTKSFCKNRIAFLLPGVDVEVIERDKKWVRVVVILDNGSVAEGWALRKYFRKEN